jgi:hypothetical protein
MYIAKGAYMNDNGAWVAEDATAVIFELNRDSETPQMFRNEGLEPGMIFTPIAVGYIATGNSSGAPVVPGTTMVLPDPLTPMLPRPHTHGAQDIIGAEVPDPLMPVLAKPHTHLYPDVVGLEDQIIVVAGSQLEGVQPHTHLVEDVVNSPRPEDTDWILAGQIFGG